MTRKYTRRELRTGTKIEYEHKPTLRMVRRYLYRNKRLPSLKKLATSISRDHLKESGKGYYKHKEYGLIEMEKELKEEKKKKVKRRKPYKKRRYY